jgi:pimeloyl-ACP methyl ester carboxylesterase
MLLFFALPHPPTDIRSAELAVTANETQKSEGEPPRSYLERIYNIRRWTVFPRGGHFAPVEAPAVVAGDVTAFFRDLS